MLKIGLTGGIGSGKTTVTQYFETLGIPVVDADEISRQLVKPGLQAYETIVQTFGHEVLNEHGELDRSKLRALIFSDAEKKLTLESILHPLIRQEISQQVQNLVSDYCIISIPLLLETNQMSLVDRVLVVDVDPQTQIKRTHERDGDDRSQIEAIIRNQVSREGRCAVADDILDNSGDIKQLQMNIDKLHLKYLDLLRKSN